MSDSILSYPNRRPGRRLAPWRPWYARSADLALRLGCLGLLVLAVLPFLHLFWPRAAVIENFAAHLRALGPDLVLMGDFNAAPWTRIQQRLRRDTLLDNAGQLAMSWPVWVPAFLRLPIDHVLARGALKVTQMETGPALGSDHLPVAARIDVTE